MLVLRAEFCLHKIFDILEIIKWVSWVEHLNDWRNSYGKFKNVILFSVLFLVLCTWWVESGRNLDFGNMSKRIKWKLLCLFTGTIVYLFYRLPTATATALVCLYIHRYILHVGTKDDVTNRRHRMYWQF